jgi:hypothetical protein
VEAAVYVKQQTETLQKEMEAAVYMNMAGRKI